MRPRSDYTFLVLFINVTFIFFPALLLEFLADLFIFFEFILVFLFLILTIVLLLVRIGFVFTFAYIHFSFEWFDNHFVVFDLCLASRAYWLSSE